MAYRKNAELLDENADLKRRVEELNAESDVHVSDIIDLEDRNRALVEANMELGYRLEAKLAEIDRLESDLKLTRTNVDGQSDLRTALEYLVTAVENSWLRRFIPGLLEALDTAHLVLGSKRNEDEEWAASA